MKLTYTNVNGYLIPNLTYKLGNQMEQLGKYGFLRRDYLKNHCNSLYQVMLLQDTIGEHLLEVDKAAREREEIILKEFQQAVVIHAIAGLKIASVEEAEELKKLNLILAETLSQLRGVATNINRIARKRMPWLTQFNLN